MRDFRICWIVSRPRVGSMWTYNVARALIADAGLRPLPAEALHVKDEVFAEGSAALADGEPSHRRVLKTHVGIDAMTPHSLFLVPDRDPRDALVSLMRFTGMDFGEALAAQEIFAELLDRYATQMPPGRMLRLAYRTINERPAEAVAQIAGFLDHRLAPRRDRQIADSLAKERVPEIVSRATMTKLVAVPGQPPRTYDLATGFQTGHVSQYRDGDWRHVLTSEQIAAVEGRLGPWLRANGYA